MFAALPTPQEMSTWDAKAKEIGIPEVVLMENAAREAFNVLREQYGPLSKTRIVLFMGGGNNGGDAACLARHLYDAGALPRLISTKAAGNARGATRLYLQLARKLGISWQVLSGLRDVNTLFKELSSPKACPEIIVDGLLGTGFIDNLREKELALVRGINNFSGHSYILSLDVPSGLNALNGKPQPEAIHANLTVTFQAAKPGLIPPESAEFTGKLAIRPIGIPKQIQTQVPASYRLWQNTPNCVNSPFFLERGLPASPEPATQNFPTPRHKGESGRVLILGGSRNLGGAPRLCALGAYRSGAGLVCISAPGHSLDIARAMPELITLELPPVTTKPADPNISVNICPEQEWPNITPPVLLHALKNYDAAVIGPGMGRHNGAEQFIRALLESGNLPPTVFDADALNALADQPALLKLLRPGDILTPHPGEAARLLNCSTSEIQSHRLQAVKKLGELAPAVWVLKGPGSLVYAPGKPVTIFPYDIPNLAVAGSGDVLAGLIGTLLAQGLPADLAAIQAVNLHAIAGLMLAQAHPYRGNLPQDIAAKIPQAQKYTPHEFTNVQPISFSAQHYTPAGE